MYIGNWKGPVPIPDQSLESRECRLEGADKKDFLMFLRHTLRWTPEERPNAESLFFYKWVLFNFVP